MDDEARAGRSIPHLLVFALATFNVLLLALVVVIVAYRDGWLSDALDPLNTLLGLGAFAALWALSWWTGTRVARGWSLEHFPPIAELWARSVFWGGVAGVIALLVPLVPALVLGLIEEGWRDALATGIWAALLYAFIACGFAFAVGAAVGFVLATIDRVVLAFALRA